LNLDHYEKVLRPANREHIQIIEKDIAGERGRVEEIEKIIQTEPEFQQK